MKKSKKAAILAAVFSASLNMNGCVYGPPEDFDDAVTTAPQTSVEASADEASTEESANEGSEVSTQNDSEPQE